MGGGNLNLKKSWHPNTLKNQEKVWKAEQEKAAEEKKIAELKRELHEERSREELQMKVSHANKGKKDEQKNLDWMYKGPGSHVSREEYLLGRKVDKSFEMLQQEEEGRDKDGQQKPVYQVEHEINPEAILRKTDDDKNNQVDLKRKLMEDPLLMIRRNEEAAKRQITDNPIKMRQLSMLVESLKSKRKKKNKRKESKKSKKEKSKRKKKKKSSDSADGNSSMDDLRRFKRSKGVEENSRLSYKNLSTNIHVDEKRRSIPDRRSASDARDERYWLDSRERERRPFHCRDKKMRDEYRDSRNKLHGKKRDTSESQSEDEKSSHNSKSRYKQGDIKISDEERELRQGDNRIMKGRSKKEYSFPGHGERMRGSLKVKTKVVRDNFLTNRRGSSGSGSDGDSSDSGSSREGDREGHKKHSSLRGRHSRERSRDLSEREIMSDKGSPYLPKEEHGHSNKDYPASRRKSSLEGKALPSKDTIPRNGIIHLLEENSLGQKKTKTGQDTGLLLTKSPFGIEEDLLHLTTGKLSTTGKKVNKGSPTSSVGELRMKGGKFCNKVAKRKKSM